MATLVGNVIPPTSRSRPFTPPTSSQPGRGSTSQAQAEGAQPVAAEAGAQAGRLSHPEHRARRQRFARDQFFILRSERKKQELKMQRTTRAWLKMTALVPVLAGGLIMSCGDDGEDPKPSPINPSTAGGAGGGGAGGAGAPDRPMRRRPKLAPRSAPRSRPTSRSTRRGATRSTCSRRRSMSPAPPS